MKRLRRSVYNRALSTFARGLSRPELARADRRILRSFKWPIALYDAQSADLLDKQWLLDAAYILADSVARTPFGEPLRLTWPLILTVGVSDSCPYQCQFCYSDALPKSSKSARLDLETFERIAESPVPHVILSGGEPMLYDGIENAIECLLDSGKNVYIATHAPASRLKRVFEKYPGSATVLYSLWGTRERHEAVRGPGSFQALWNNLRQLQDMPVYGSLNCLIAREDLSALDAAAEIRDAFDIHRVFVSRVLGVGRQSEPISQPDAPYIRNLEAKLAQVRRSRFDTMVNVPELSTSSPQRKLGERLLTFLGIEWCDGCSAANWAMHIGPSGSYYPCFGFETSRPVGTLGLHKSLREAWHEVRDHRATLGATQGCLAESSQASPAVSPFSPLQPLGDNL